MFSPVSGTCLGYESMYFLCGHKIVVKVYMICSKGGSLLLSLSWSGGVLT